MRQWIAATCLALSSCLAFAEGEQSARNSVAILPLKNKADQSLGDQGDSVYQRVSQAFLKIKRFEVVERNELDSIMGEAQLQNSGVIDESSAVALGKQAGAAFVVVGSFTGQINREVSSYKDEKGYVQHSESFPAKINVNLRMVDVQSGRIEKSFTVQAAGKSANPASSLASMLEDLSKKMERTVSNEFPLSGYVIKIVSEKEAMIDIGSSSGVAKGDEFSVIKRGEDLVHPVTGKVIKGEKTVVAECDVKQTDDETAVVKVSGGTKSLAVGMMVESKPKKKGFMESLNDFSK